MDTGSENQNQNQNQNQGGQQYDQEIEAIRKQIGDDKFNQLVKRMTETQPKKGADGKKSP